MFKQVVRAIISLAVFSLLAFHSIQLIKISRTSVPEAKFYSDSWNGVLQDSLKLQQSILGEIKLNLVQEFSVVTVTEKLSLHQNIGILSLIGGCLAFARSSLLRSAAILYFGSLTLIFARNNAAQYSQERLNEIIVNTVAFVGLILINCLSPRCQSKVENVSEQKQTTTTTTTDTVSAKKAKKQKQQQAEEEAKVAAEEKAKKEAAKQIETLVKSTESHQDERQELTDEDDQSNDLSAALTTTSEPPRRSKRLAEKAEKELQEEEEEEERRKFKVDDDGFSVIPKKGKKASSKSK